MSSMRWGVLALGLCVLDSAPCRADEGRSSPVSPVEWRADDRVLVLAPHPGDEVLGGGATIPAARSNGLPVQVVFLTCGEYSQWSLQLYRKRLVVPPGEIRMKGPQRIAEARKAGRKLGLESDDLVFLGYPDFGVFDMWCHHWAEAMPFRSLLTRTWQVPYAEVFHPEAPYKGEVLLADLKQVIRAFRPTRILVSHPADYHPDHQALYLFTRVALMDLGGEVDAELLPYLVHYPQWPGRLRHEDQWLMPPPDLVSAIAWRGVAGDPAAAEARKQVLRLYRKDMGTSDTRLRQFSGPSDLFGDFPDVPLAGGIRLLDVGGGESLPPDDLSPEEKERFIGIRTRTVQVERNSLILDMELTAPLKRRVDASVYFFGYRPDQPFEQMPKIQIVVDENSEEVFDRGTRWPRGLVAARQFGSNIQLEIPLEALGNPELIFTGARTYLNEIPLDWAPWRVLTLRNDASTPASSSAPASVPTGE